MDLHTAQALVDRAPDSRTTTVALHHALLVPAAAQSGDLHVGHSAFWQAGRTVAGTTGAHFDVFLSMPGHSGPATWVLRVDVDTIVIRMRPDRAPTPGPVADAATALAARVQHRLGAPDVQALLADLRVVRQADATANMLTAAADAFGRVRACYAAARAAEAARDGDHTLARTLQALADGFPGDLAELDLAAVHLAAAPAAMTSP